MNLAHSVRSDADLEDVLSAPSDADLACCRRLNGDVLVIGAGGKMGPSLVRRIARAFAAVGAGHHVFAASRFSDSASRHAIDACGAKTLAVDLLQPERVDALPDCPHVLFLAGRKFGSSEDSALTWVTNTVVAGNVARRFSRSRIVAFSTGNVYPFVPVSSAGSLETDAPSPRGEYAQSCLGRERVFEYWARHHNTPTLLFRLNYAVDLRYGVLVDIARNVKAGHTVNRTVSHFNVIWQGDANSYALRALEGCRVPARVLNVTGSETVSVTDAANYFGTRFGIAPKFSGQPGGDALLSDARACHAWLGLPRVGTADLMDAVAAWLERGGRTLDKPTHFEAADGKF